MFKASRFYRVWESQELTIAIAIAVLSGVIAVVNPRFCTLENGLDLLSHYAFLGILALGLLVVLVSGGIDISFIATATVAQYVMAIVLVTYGGSVVVAGLVAALAGTVLGLINALVIHWLRIPSIVATIATLNMYYGALLWLSGGRWIDNLPQSFRAFGSRKVWTWQREDGTLYGLSVMAAIFLLAIPTTALLLKYTTVGRKIYALGGSATAAWRAGFSILLVQLLTYGYMGLMAGAAGLVHALDVQTIAPNALIGKELDVFAAAVLGGASLTGGVGTVGGTVLGVALLAVMSNGLTLARVPAVWHQVAVGVVILTSVTLNSCRIRRMPRRRPTR